MKLKSLALIITIYATMLASCGNSDKTDNNSFVEEETREVVSQDDTDSYDADKVRNDSIVTRGGTASEGFGRCSKCNCKAFEGRGQTCRNCGHAYKAHY